jgi:FkbM family methyltransferase
MITKIDLSEIIHEIVKNRHPSNRIITVTNDLWINLKNWHDELLRTIPWKTKLEIIFPQGISINLPLIDLKAISVLHLLGPHELVIFSNYFAIKDRGLAVDLGANIGLHSILLSKLGFEVECYEPDPLTFNILKTVCKINDAKINSKCSALVSNDQGAQSTSLEFVRVIDNPTASGISGTDKKFYGNTETFSVNVTTTSSLPKNGSIIKIDIEGNEVPVLLDLLNQKADFSYINFEVSSQTAANTVFNALHKQDRYEWWNDKSHATNPDLRFFPQSWRDGSIHLGRKPL